MTYDSKSADLSALEKALATLPEEERQTVMLEVEGSYGALPPMSRSSQPSPEEVEGYLLDYHVGMLNRGASSGVNVDIIDQMMSSGQIAYPMALKKAPVIGVVNADSGFSVKSADERLSEVVHANLREILPKVIGEILTFLEYGAFYGETVWTPEYPQGYGLAKSAYPYWVIDDIHGCHPNTIQEILRNKKTRSFEGFVQAASWMEDPVTIGLDRALIIANDGLFGDLQGKSILEPVYVWWFWFELVWRSFLRYLKRAGEGTVIVRAPSKGRILVNGQKVDCMAWAIQMAQSLHRTNYAALPSDTYRESGERLWTIDLQKTGNDQAGNGFISALELLSDNINRFLLTGSADSENDEFAVMLDTERILSHIGLHISQYVLRKSLRYNGSKATKIWLDFQGANSRVLPLLFKLMAVAGNTAGDALQNVNWRELFIKGGVPTLTEKEVDEIKEQAKQEAQEAFEQQQKAKKADAEEKAKQQPGGEGRWSSQRDKEGKTESLEMIQQALNTSLVALSVRQVEILERLGLRGDDSTVELFNPYHDDKGRFTSKQGASGAIGFAGGKEEVGRVAGALQERISGISAKNVKLHEEWPGFLANTYGVPALGAYNPVTKTTHVSPKGLEAIEKGKESDYLFGKYKDVHPAHPVAHEIIHSRRRKGGKTLPLGGPQLTKWSKFFPNDVEEGATELLTRRFMKDFYGKKTTHTVYQHYTVAVADWAWHTSGGNASKAWKLIDDLHLNTHSFKSTRSFFEGTNSNWKSSSRPSYSWLSSHLRDTGIDWGTGYEELLGHKPESAEFTWFSDEVERFEELVEEAKNTKDEVKRWLLFEEIRLIAPYNKSGTELYNPHHDNLGRFATASHAVAQAGWAAFVTSGILAIGSGVVNITSGEIRKAKGKKKRDIALSMKIRGNEYSLTYGEIEKESARVFATSFKVGVAAFGVSCSAALARDLVDERKYKKDEEWRKSQWEKQKKRYERTYRESRWDYKPSGKSSWPSGSTEKEFKGMYRKLAKVYHPDHGGSKDIMQEINAAYERQDWSFIESLYKKLEAGGGERFAAALFVLAAMMRMVEEGADFISFEDDGGKSIFPVEDGRAYIDAEMVRNIYGLTQELIGLAVDRGDGSEKLENPYHDTGGRFTDKRHAAKPYPEDRFKLSGKVSERAAFRVNDAAAMTSEALGIKGPNLTLYADGSAYGAAVCGQNKACLLKTKRTYAAARDGDIFVGPHLLEKIEKDRKFGSYSIVHEMTHTRKRSDGSLGLQIKEGRAHRNYGNVLVEEGTTDLLARRAMGVNHRYWANKYSSPVYKGHMGTVASLAGVLSGGDRDKAWKLIDEIHFNINDDDYMHGLFTKALGGEPKNGWDDRSYFSAVSKFGRAAEWSRYKDLKWLYGED